MLKKILLLFILIYKHGIRHRLTCVDTREQNGSIKCKNKHTTDTGMSLLAGATLPLKIWDFGMSLLLLFM